MRLRLVVLAVCTVALPFALWSVLPVFSEAGQTPGQIQKKIDRNKSLIGGHKAHERLLTTDISSQTDRIDALQGSIDKLSVRQEKLQTSLDSKRAQLAKVQDQLRQERARLKPAPRSAVSPSSRAIAPRRSMRAPGWPSVTGTRRRRKRTSSWPWAATASCWRRCTPSWAPQSRSSA